MNMIKSVMITSAKLGVDLMAAIPAFEWLFFRRMNAGGGRANMSELQAFIKRWEMVDDFP